MRSPDQPPSDGLVDNSGLSNRVDHSSDTIVSEDGRALQVHIIAAIDSLLCCLTCNGGD